MWQYYELSCIKLDLSKVYLLAEFQRNNHLNRVILRLRSD